MRHTEVLQPFVGDQIRDIWAFELVDYYENCTPRMFYFVFNKASSFLTIELTGDAEHIDLSVSPVAQLDEELIKYTGQGYIWKPIKWTHKAPFDKLISIKIDKIELAKEKEEFQINDKAFACLQGSYLGIRFHFGTDNLVIFDNGDESYMGYNSEWEPMFQDTYDWYSVDEKNM